MRTLLKLKEKYPITVHDTVGYLDTKIINNETVYITSSNIAKVDNIEELKRCTGLHKSKRIMLLTALYLFRLKNEIIELEIYKDKIKTINKPNSNLINSEIKDNILHIFNEITEYDVFESASRMAQLRVEYPAIYDKFIDTLNWFTKYYKTKDITPIISSELFGIAYKNLKQIKDR